VSANERKAYAPGTVTVTVGDERITGVNRLAYNEPIAYAVDPHAWTWMRTPPASLYVGRMAWTRHTHEAWRECMRVFEGQPVESITVDRLRAMLSQAHGYTAGDPPNHGPWHRDAKHVAWLLAQWRDVVRERTAASGTVHEGVLVTG